VNIDWKPSSQAWNRIERRKSKRLASEQAVRILLPAKGTSIHGKLVDLSEGGCSVEPDVPFLVWSEVRVEIRFEASQMQFKMTGVTKGDRGGNRFGVEFDGMTTERLAELKLLLPAYRSSQTKTEALVVLVDTEQDASPIDLSAEDVEASRKAMEQLLRTGRRSGMVRIEEPPGGKERRVHSRYVVEAQAVLLLIRSNETLAGYVLEVSQSGCRIYLSEPFDKGLGVPLEVNFQLHGIPVRMPGVCQVLVDKHTIGIRFSELSGRKQQQLNELISEINMV